MTTAQPFTPDRIVKSQDRVRDLGEVFTPAHIVNDMLDLLPKKIWDVKNVANFFEPACGDGNFLVAILDRKLDEVAKHWKSESLPAGLSTKALQFHALQALASIYAVDISKENILGGSVEHPVGARDRLLHHLVYWFEIVAKEGLDNEEPFVLSATWILEKNILIANMLAFDAEGKLTKRESIPFVEYEWHPTKHFVSISQTTFGQILDEAENEYSDAMTLFGSEPVEVIWNDSFLDLHTAEVLNHKVKSSKARNGNGKNFR